MPGRSKRAPLGGSLFLAMVALAGCGGGELENLVEDAYEAASSGGSFGDGYIARTPDEERDLRLRIFDAFQGGGGGPADIEEAKDAGELGECTDRENPLLRILVSADGTELSLAASDSKQQVTLSYEVGADPETSEPEPCSSG